MDEIEILLARHNYLLETLATEPVTKEQADSIIEELAEIQTAAGYDPLTDQADARLCRKFSESL
jgi:hypothetical protein